MPCAPCITDKGLFTFSDEIASFKNATQVCSNLGGHLAVVTDLLTWKHIHSCCEDSGQFFRIGLEVCANGFYRWVTESTCKDVKPLITADHSIHNCTRTLVAPGKLRPNGYPTVFSHICDGSLENFICQSPVSSISNLTSLPYLTSSDIPHEVSGIPTGFEMATVRTDYHFDSESLGVMALVVVGLVLLMVLLSTCVMTMQDGSRFVNCGEWISRTCCTDKKYRKVFRKAFSLTPEDEEDTTAIVEKNGSSYRARQAMELQRYRKTNHPNETDFSLLSPSTNFLESTEFITGPIDEQGYQVPLPFHEVDISDEVGYDVPVEPTGLFHAHCMVQEYGGQLTEYAVVKRV